MSLSPKRGTRAALVAVWLPVITTAPTATSAHPPTLRGVAEHPHAIDVLVNKQVRLPRGFRPRALVVPNVPFIFSGFHEKRQLRRVAARALERLFGAAVRNGVPLAGVSGYRSEATQRRLFNYYVEQRGLTEASRVSARPGHSEHQTGLAIDVTGADGRCPASACFAKTAAARWLAKHAADYGFVVRYPAGGEATTGYKYEPWHLRYLGRSLATALVAAQLTYEQFLARGAGPFALSAAPAVIMLCHEPPVSPRTAERSSHRCRVGRR